MSRVTALVSRELMGSSELMMVLESTRVSGLIIHDGLVPAGR